MRKVILFALVGIVLSVASYGVYETQSRKQTMSDILLANIEAISQWENLEECGGGPWYQDVSISIGMEETRIHSGSMITTIDEIHVWNYKRCNATGVGSQRGATGSITCIEDRSKVREIMCEGFLLHKEIPDCKHN